MTTPHEVVAYHEGRSLFSIFIRRNAAAFPGVKPQQFDKLDPRIKATWQLTAAEFLWLSGVDWTQVEAGGPPRGPRNTIWSEYVWLLLSDGRVVLGEALYNKGTDNIHSWFVNQRDGSPSRAIDASPETMGLRVIAWAALVPPAAPGSLFRRDGPDGDPGPTGTPVPNGVPS